MANVNQISLLEKEYAYYTQLLKNHERNKREKELKSLTIQKSCQNPNIKKYSIHNYNKLKNTSQSITHFPKKYSFQKSNIPSTSSLNKRTVVYNLNQNFKAKSTLSKTKLSNHASLMSKHKLKNSPSVSGNKSLILTAGSRPDKVSCKPPNESKKPISATKDFIKEIESLTELLKKKSSEIQPSRLTSTAKSRNNQTKLLKKHDFNNLNSMKSKGLFSKTNNMTNISTVNHSSIKPSVGTRKLNNCHTNAGSFNKNCSASLKPNKYSYKKVNVTQTINLSSGNNLKTVCKPRNKFQESPVTQIKMLDSNSTEAIQVKGKCNIIKSLPLEKQNSKLHTHKVSSAIKSHSAIKIKSPIIYKTKPSLLTPAKVIKVKCNGTKYSKINNRLVIPKYVNSQPRLSSTKKIKKKIATKYRLINKNLTPCPNKNERKFIRKDKENSLSFDSDPLLKDLNDPAIEKLEKNLFAMSTALNPSPIAGKNDVNSKRSDNSLINSRLHLKKTPMRKCKSRISKYKFVKSHAALNLSLSKKRNSPKFVVKKVKRSKFSIINTHVQPKTVIPSSKQGTSILVRRLYKSKNVIINKNANPINFSAKMIKSKYFSLNKRKFTACHKYGLYPRKPVHHPKFKGYSSIFKNGYKSGISYHPTVTRKFVRGHPFTARKHCSKNIYVKKHRVNNGYPFAPVVFINGSRYAVNSSRKTLRKLSVKDQIKRYGSLLLRTPDRSIKTLTSTPTANLASRVLHRSINRVLTASSKKSLSKVNTYCMFYNRFGRCNRGVKCTYIHDPRKIAVCTRFLRGTCKVDKCPFSHEIDPGKMAICSYFLVGACEVQNCPYRHEKLSPNAVLCKAFVQGYCPKGKECKNAHILICPKYMQGECDKGRSCEFPHPPQKAKKNVQKDVEDEDKKQDDALLEKVFRYFQQGGDSTEVSENKSLKNDNSDSCVPPRKRKLGEQPSFIPL